MSAAEQLALGGWLREKPDEPETEEYRKEKDDLLRRLASSELARIEVRVASILERFPETRDSTVLLAITLWREFQPSVLEEYEAEGIEVLRRLSNFETIARSRRHIQNDLKLWQGSSEVVAFREALQRDMKMHIIAQKEVAPEIRVYLDETGNDSKTLFLGVGGVCVMNWQQYRLPHAALREWRETLGPATLHCADLGRDADLAKHLAFLDRIRQRRPGLLFIAHNAHTRMDKREIFAGLFVGVVVDALKVMEREGCLNDHRALTLIKEAEEGFDALWGEHLQANLQEAVEREFGDRVYVNPVQAVPKGREVMLECADHIAWGMYRRANSGGRYSKDVLAEAVMNVTGFEDPRDHGTVFKAHRWS
jgi:hypothetical protein